MIGRAQTDGDAPLPIMQVDGLKERMRYLLVRAAMRVPWPLGDAAIRASGVIFGVVASRHFRLAREWARQQPGTRRPWRLALSLLANGTRGFSYDLVTHGAPEAVRRRIVLEGAEHLEAARRRGATLVLGFHHIQGADLALRILGYRMTVVGARGPEAWWRLRRLAWAPFLDPGENPFLIWSREHWIDTRVAILLKVRRLLLAGQTVFIAADGWGSEAFKIPLPGCELSIRAGWFALRRHTDAATLPALARYKGRQLVVTIHPPLPAVHPDLELDLARCRDAMSYVLIDYVHRFPDQCDRFVTMTE